MKEVEVGSNVRLSSRIWGTVTRRSGDKVTIAWTRQKRVTQTRASKKIDVTHIVPDAAPLNPQIPWRLRYWLEYPGGVGVDGLQSEVSASTAEGAPYSPIGD